MSALEKIWDFATKPRVETAGGTINNIFAAGKSIVAGTAGNVIDRSKEFAGGVWNIIKSTAGKIRSTLSLNPLTLAAGLTMMPIDIAKGAVNTVENITKGIGRAANDVIKKGALNTYDHLGLATKDLAKTITLSNLAQNSENKFAKAYGKSMGAIIDIAGPTQIPSNATHWAVDSIKKGADKS